MFIFAAGILTFTFMKNILFILAFTFVCSLLPIASFSQWQQTNGPYCGNISSLALKGDSIYTLYGSEIFLSTNNGQNWINKFGVPLSNTLVFRGSYIFSGGYGINLSTDNGSTWTPVNNGLPYDSTHHSYPNIQSMALIGKYIFAGSTYHGVFLSTNNGSGWSDINDSLTRTTITSLAINDSNLFAGTLLSGIFLSTDYGAHWNAINNGLKNKNISSLGISNENVFAGTNGGVFLSTNNGANWIKRIIGLTDTIVNCIAINGSYIFAGTKSGVFLSSDNGASWKIMNNGLPSIPNIQTLSIQGINIYAGTYGYGLFMSTNNGANWSLIGIPVSIVYSLTNKDDSVFAGTTGWAEGAGGEFLCNNNGVSWKLFGLYNNSIECFAINGKNMFAGTEAGGVFLSTDNGESWTAKNNGLPKWSSTGYFSVYDIKLKGNYIFAGTEEGIYYSTDMGTNWIFCTSGGCVTLVFKGDTIFAGVYMAGGVLVSSDNGLTWSNMNKGLPKNDDHLYPIATSGNNIFVTTEHGLYLSTNNGNNWYPINHGLNDSTRVGSLVISGSNVFAGTEEGGVFLSTNNGSNWHAVNYGFPYLDIYSLALSGDYIYAGTDGTGVWKRSISDIMSKTKYILGNLTYDNKSNTPLKNVKLYLINSKDTIIDSTFTDATGHYIFNNVYNGNYTLLPAPNTLPVWGGVNPADALLIDRSYISLYNFTDGLLKRAGDINEDGKVNPIDALLINRRYIHLINKFKVSDWLFDNLNVTVNGDNVIHNIKAVCAGDVNGSYKP